MQTRTGAAAATAALATTPTKIRSGSEREQFCGTQQCTVEGFVAYGSFLHRGPHAPRPTVRLNITSCLPARLAGFTPPVTTRTRSPPPCPATAPQSHPPQQPPPITLTTEEKRGAQTSIQTQHTWGSWTRLLAEAHMQASTRASKRASTQCSSTILACTYANNCKGQGRPAATQAALCPTRLTRSQQTSLHFPGDQQPRAHTQGPSAQASPNNSRTTITCTTRWRTGPRRGSQQAGARQSCSCTAVTACGPRTAFDTEGRWGRRPHWHSWGAA